MSCLQSVPDPKNAVFRAGSAGIPRLVLKGGGESLQRIVEALMQQD